jgi:hypothetical protein
MSKRATWQPSVPAPNRRHLVEDKVFKSNDGKARHLISFKFRSAADIDSFVGSIDLASVMARGFF